MDYETPDGSQFSLREIYSETDGNEQRFSYTSISATVDGKAFYGRLEQRIDDVDVGDVLSSLQPVPSEAIYPAFSEKMTEVPALDPTRQYLKAPSFTWDDCQLGTTFVADCTLNELKVLERIRQFQHPNIVPYHGCVVKEGRVTHICLERCEGNIVDYFEDRSCDTQKLTDVLRDVKAGIDFLHLIGLAHNDIFPGNICIKDERAVIVDFDSCIPLGQRLLKGSSSVYDSDDYPISAAENDLEGLEELEDFLVRLLPSDTHATS